MYRKERCSGVELHVQAGGHGLLRQRQGHGVVRKGQGAGAVQVARELVQHHDLGQPPAGRGAPGPQLALHGSGVHRAEALADGGVEPIVAREALPGRGFIEPEMQDVLGFHGGQAGHGGTKEGAAGCCPSPRSTG